MKVMTAHLKKKIKNYYNQISNKPPPRPKSKGMFLQEKVRLRKKVWERERENISLYAGSRARNVP